MARSEELTDEQWELIAALIPAPVRRPDGRGRPWRANRERVKRDSLDLTLGGTLARLPRALSPVPDLPSALLAVGASGRPAQGLRSLSREFTHARGVGPQRVLYRCDLHWGEKKGRDVGATKRGKGTQLMAVADGPGLPLAVHTASAAPHEVTLVYPTLLRSFLSVWPQRLIGDRAYDSDPLDYSLALGGLELIAPHKRNRQRPSTQDGRPLRRYRRRWKVERLFAWLHDYRRILTRFEYHTENYLGFVHLGCILILLRCYL